MLNMRLILVSALYLFLSLSLLLIHARNAAAFSVHAYTADAKFSLTAVVEQLAELQANEQLC